MLKNKEICYLVFCFLYVFIIESNEFDKRVIDVIVMVIKFILCKIKV